MGTRRSVSGGPDGRDVDEAVLWALFSESPIGLHVMDTQLRLVRFNTAARHIQRMPLDDAVGRHVGEWAGDFYDADLEAAFQGVLETGRPVTDLVLRGHAGTAELVISLSCFRLRDADGRTLGVASAVVDVTEQHRARARLDLIYRAGASIGSGLDLVRTAQELADATVPDLADTVVVEVLDPVLRGEAPPPGALDPTTPLRCVGHCSAAETPDGGIAVGEMTGVPYATPFSQCLADLGPRLVARLTPDVAWLAREDVRGRRMLDAGTHSLMVVPLAARGAVLGLAHFHRRGTAAPFEADDLAVAAELADIAAVNLDNARLYTRERSTARMLQLSLRPAEVAGHAAVETAYSYLPVGSGGDWFDVIPLSGARVALVAGDTPGRGLPAAAAMGELRAAIGALAVLDFPPDEVLSRLHDLVTRLEGEHQAAQGPRGGLVSPGATTCLYVVYDPVSRRCVVASAGHPPPLLALPDGTVEYIDVRPGPALGRSTADHRPVERELPEGSVLALCNSAVFRAGSDSPETRLERFSRAMLPTTRPLQEICDGLLYALVPEGEEEDDAVLLLARTRVLGPGNVASLTVPHAPESAAEARAFVERQLADWDLAEHSFGAALVVSELVTNAIRYSGGSVLVRLVVDGSHLVCEVSDDSSTAPHLRHAEADDEGGRGLHITSQISRSWGIRPERQGKTIWAELALSDAAL
ncbi:SpoIIE family protein phosphatase [Streptomyces sp. NPDC048845]|uniref:SpoIIE family protein phosphatase n=1 Tax=Streptomyces sp. NPDC048845 TaxID=3155390 RepID=UPI00343DC2EA